MPREPRIYSEKALYMVTAKGDEDTNLFNDREDYEVYLSLLREYKREYGFQLYAFTLMPKSLCLLIQLKNKITISTIMHNLNNRYTKNYNSRYGKKGHLFQSRFKSKLVEKEDYLLRLTRFIHLFPKVQRVTDDLSQYVYSSFSLYAGCGPELDARPDMKQEIEEVLGYFPNVVESDNPRSAYVSYVQSAAREEFAAVEKLLHRKAFVGSKQFIAQMRNCVKEHIEDEEKSHIIRKSNPAFVLSGCVMILFLSIVSVNLYRNQSSLQKTLNVTSSGFEVAREDLAQRVHGLKKELSGYEQKANHGLGGRAWEVKLTPVQEEYQNGSYTDKLEFKDGQLVSAKLTNQGFVAFEYTIKEQSHGKRIWQTVQTSPDGTTVRWYGIITGDKMRGVLTEENPVQGKNRDFSFVSVRRLNNAGGTNYVIQ